MQKKQNIKLQPLSLEELQNLEFDILVSFHEFCEQHHLRYYLCGGTLIGAIRHKGFIPWDDDIDVMMPRPDYMKFIELTKGRLDETKKLDSLYLNKNPFSAITRIYDIRTETFFKTSTINYTLGCWIDVYPLDGFSSHALFRKISCKTIRLLQILIIYRSTKCFAKRKNKVLTFFQYFLLPFLPLIYSFKYGIYLSLFEKISQHYSYAKSEFVGVYDGRAGEGEVMRKSDMEPAIKVDFWGKKFYAMANYDTYLKNLYGDYMTLPPEAERISRHEINVYWKVGEKK